MDGSNLIVKAAELLRRDCGRPELSAQLSLSKCIPIGAGLAGGSGDGATALMLLNRYWDLQLSAAELQQLAASWDPMWRFACRAALSCVLAEASGSNRSIRLLNRRCC